MRQQKKEIEFLLVQESEHFKGKWNLPMGRKENGESIVDCALRETFEESGFKVKLQFLLGVYEKFTVVGDVVAFIFEANIIRGKLRVPEDLLDVQWVSLKESRELNLVSNYILKAVEVWKKPVSAKIPAEEIIFEG